MYKIKKGIIRMNLNSQCYPLESIFATCIGRLEDFYFYLDKSKKGSTIVEIRSKSKNLGEKKLKKIAGEFLNDLAENVLRFKISQRNKKIREYIVKEALFFSKPYQEMDKVKPAQDSDLVYKEDPLGIAIPWEEREEKSKR